MGEMQGNGPTAADYAQASADKTASTARERFNMALFEHLTPAHKMALAARLIEEATGYQVVHDGYDDEPHSYLRPINHERYAEMRLRAVDPAVMGPPTRYKHDGCGGGLVLAEATDEYTCRRCHVVLSRTECHKRRALGEPGGYAPEEKAPEPKPNAGSQVTEATLVAILLDANGANEYARGRLTTLVSALAYSEANVMTWEQMPANQAGELWHQRAAHVRATIKRLGLPTTMLEAHDRRRYEVAGA